MKTNHIYYVLLLVAGMVSFTSCERMMNKALESMNEDMAEAYEYEDSEKLGKVVSLPMELGDFSKIDVFGSVQVVYTQDSVCHVTLYGNEKSIEKYKVEVDDGELDVKLKENTTSVNSKTPKMTLYISAPVLSSLEVSGGGRVDLKDVIAQTSPLEIDLQGAANLTIDYLEVQDLDVEVSGAGNMKLDRVIASEDISVEIQGAGNLKGQLQARDVKAEVSGAGNIELNVDCRKLNAGVTGVGNVTLTGKCETLRTSSNEVSRVNTDSLKVTGK